MVSTSLFVFWRWLSGREAFKGMYLRNVQILSKTLFYVLSENPLDNRILIMATYTLHWTRYFFTYQAVSYLWVEKVLKKAMNSLQQVRGTFSKWYCFIWQAMYCHSGIIQVCLSRHWIASKIFPPTETPTLYLKFAASTYPNLGTRDRDHRFEQNLVFKKYQNSVFDIRVSWFNWVRIYYTLIHKLTCLHMCI